MKHYPSLHDLTKNEEFLGLLKQFSHKTFVTLRYAEGSLIFNNRHSGKPPIDALIERLIHAHGIFENIIEDNTIIDHEIRTSWCGITTETFNERLFVKMIQAYTKAGGKVNQKHFHAAFYGILGNWLNWMVYNIERACNSAPNALAQKTLAEEQVKQVLAIIVQAQSQLPLLTQTYP